MRTQAGAKVCSLADCFDRTSDFNAERGDGGTLLLELYQEPEAAGDDDDSAERRRKRQEDRATTALYNITTADWTPYDAAVLAVCGSHPKPPVMAQPRPPLRW